MEVAVHDKLDELGKKGKAQDWIIAALIAYLDVPNSDLLATRHVPSSDELGTQSVPTSDVKQNPDAPIHNSFVLPKSANGTRSAMLPNDVIAERKRLAQAKHPGVPPRKGE